MFGLWCVGIFVKNIRRIPQSTAAICDGHQRLEYNIAFFLQKNKAERGVVSFFRISFPALGLWNIKNSHPSKKTEAAPCGPASPPVKDLLQDQFWKNLIQMKMMSCAIRMKMRIL